MKKNMFLAMLVMLAAATLFTACPKEPEAGPLDGLWVAQSQFQGYDVDFVKMTFNGNSVRGCHIDVDATGEAYQAAGSTGAPTPVWAAEQTGTFTISGSTITFASADEDFNGKTATLSADRTSFEMNVGDEAHPMMATFHKR